ncbi:hypothetical protein Kpol_1043p65 [Vanderwaltozyma polyspora DSM 70294]|uniref:AB hydrolase-1 domain-containing protein n=1 Tax=Vanderwaltozyma polyspora (strain ATCC 22028 / DSM 70294 / BCRC 21397 / CBS 2163 / NBRC 10782 / NRRL Y-8283 / UCD 57-17) TaxID=436907 RepID=A7TIT2_VANPO|nr:uncharacterized protein Kpol_1043p65 [Vanderwaltozyma polyspora DSM 70294]EDO17874.1 hypothetical protein Kpol_1043p65 [Vanderwaltozyma polyspora DSM 70294]
MMDKIIRDNYQRETKIIDAVYPRTYRDSTIVHSDRLQCVYDVFTYTGDRLNDEGVKMNLMFLHGSGMNRFIWDYYVAHLLDYKLGAAINKIVTLDQVTHGDSSVLNRGKLGVGYDWSDGARDACKVAQKEFYSGLEDNSDDIINIVVGHSMGGFQAMCCGVLLPSLFDFIVTIEPVAYSPNVPNNSNVTVLPPKFFKAIASKVEDEFKNEAEYDKFMHERSFFTKTHPEIFERFKETERINMEDGSIRTKMERRQEMLCYMTLHPTSYWLLDGAKHIKVPVVSLVGGIATWAPKENQQVLQKSIPNYTVDVVPQGDHLMNIEMPDEMLKRLSVHFTKFAKEYQSKNYDNSNKSVARREEIFEEIYKETERNRVKNGKPVLAKL